VGDDRSHPGDLAGASDRPFQGLSDDEIDSVSGLTLRGRQLRGLGTPIYEERTRSDRVGGRDVTHGIGLADESWVEMAGVADSERGENPSRIVKECGGRTGEARRLAFPIPSQQFPNSVSIKLQYEMHPHA